MIELQTNVPTTYGIPSVTYDHHLLMMGSCFAENMGKLFTEHAFQIDVNPTGVIYNPLSISTALREFIIGRPYKEDDLFFFRECWHSFMHHSSFSSPSARETIININQRLREVHTKLPSTDWLMITFGTAYVYEYRKTGKVVANCHKISEKKFIHRRLTVEEIVTEYISVMKKLWRLNPGMKMLFTVSPIRHLRDGLHENQLSKSTLLLAIDALKKAYPEKVFYFPAYEILNDELRDYRYYADDMLHPSPLAIRVVWEKLMKSIFSDETQRYVNEVAGINRSFAHRPFHPESEEHKRFLRQLMLRIKRLKEKCPNLDFRKQEDYVIPD